MNLNGKIIIENSFEKNEFLCNVQIIKDLKIFKCNEFEITYDNRVKKIIKRTHNNSYVRIDIENENMYIKDGDINTSLKIKIKKFINKDKSMYLEYSIDSEKIVMEINY